MTSYQKNWNSRRIKIWKPFYFNYDVCHGILKELQGKYHQKIQSDYQQLVLDDCEESDINRGLLKAQLYLNEDKFFEKSCIFDRISTQMEIELQKIDKFYNEIFYRRATKKLGNIRKQLEFARITNQLGTYMETFDIAIKELFKEGIAIQIYVSTNFSGIRKIVSKYEKYVAVFNNQPKHKLEEFVDHQLKKLSFGNSESEIERFLDQIHETFNFYFREVYEAKGENCYDILNKYSLEQEITTTQGFWLGMFIGLLLFELSIIIIIYLNYNLDIDNDQIFSSVFPMFRSFFAICLYMWCIGFVIWAWSKVKINYRLLFECTGVSIPVIDIYKTAAMFTFILLTCLIFYIIGRAKIDVFFGHYFPIDLLPLVFWGSLIVWLFCPFDIFNSETRKFIFDSLGESIVSFLSRPTFRDSFFVGNMSSFIGPMRDIEYSLCYYAYYDASLDDKKFFCSKSRGIYLFIAFFPHILKILSSSRQIVLTGAYQSHFWGIVKHSVSLVTSTLSFMTPYYPWFFYIWLPCTIFNAVLSFSIDIKRDFKLLESKGFPLRHTLLYSPSFIYYFICIIDIFLRFAWVIHLSPEIIHTFIRPQTLSLLLYSAEIFRRSMWNLIRCEVKFLEKAGQYKLSTDISLPFVIKDGKYTHNDDNLVELMGLNRQERIKHEVENLFSDKKLASYKSSLYMPDYHTDKFDSNKNEDLEKVLSEYREKTKKNKTLDYGSN